MSEDGDFFSKVGTNASTAARRTPPPSDAPVETTEAAATTPERFLESSASGVRRWAANEPIYWAAKATYDKLPAGRYSCHTSQNIGPFVEKQPLVMDDLLILPDNASRSIIAEFKKFWKLKAAFKKRGFLHKRGMLLWGPPGSGKTSLIQVMTKLLIKELDGIVLFLERPDVAVACLKMVRMVEPKRPIICIMEDFEALVAKYGDAEYLSLLDGENNVDNVVYLATTNYPEKLDRRFVDRPSRFDRIMWIGMPSSGARRAYFRAKEPELGEEATEEWVKRSKGFSIAHLREMIIACQCYGHKLDDVIARLDKMKSRRPSSENSPENGGGKSKMGFGSSAEEYDPDRDTGED